MPTPRKKAKAKPKSKNPKEKRDYQRERQYDGRPEVKAKRAARNRARRAAEKEGLVKKGDGKDVDHVTPLRKDSKATKTRVVSAAKNRAWRKGKKGYD
jgi:hypothetical protein